MRLGSRFNVISVSVVFWAHLEMFWPKNQTCWANLGSLTLGHGVNTTLGHEVGTIDELDAWYSNGKGNPEAVESLEPLSRR